MLQLICEYLSEDGTLSDECLAGRSAIRLFSETGERGDPIWLTPEPSPNAATIESMNELMAGGGEQFASFEELRKDLGV